MKWFMVALFFNVAVFAQNTKLVVLGTAQDAGYPQIGCTKKCCDAVLKDGRLRRMATSLLLEDGKQRFLFEATPDIREQMTIIGPHPNSKAEKGKRPKLVDGVFLTHAHMGHYTGLLHLGREVYNHPKIPVYGSKRLCDFLASNGPWRLLSDNGNIQLTALVPDQAIAPMAKVKVTPFHVPHREEFSDTFGYLIQGPQKAALFIPDINKWEHWAVPIEQMIAKVDYALLDGTFYADGEIPGRKMSEIPHPFISESIARFQTLPEQERKKVFFIHLNHSNPAIDENSAASQAIRKAGMQVVRDLQVFEL